MRKAKAVIMLSILLCCCLVLSSCGGKEFKYDDAITWHSSADDIISKYGQPKKQEETYIYYKNFNCCGYDSFVLTFCFRSLNGAFYAIELSSKLSDNMLNDILNALNTKYGKHTREYEAENYDLKILQWDSIAKDTTLSLEIYPKAIRIKYENLQQTNQSNLDLWKQNDTTPEPATNGI